MMNDVTSTLTRDINVSECCGWKSLDIDAAVVLLTLVLHRCHFVAFGIVVPDAPVWFQLKSLLHHVVLGRRSEVAADAFVMEVEESFEDG